MLTIPHPNSVYQPPQINTMIFIIFRNSRIRCAAVVCQNRDENEVTEPRSIQKRGEKTFSEGWREEFTLSCESNSLEISSFTMKSSLFHDELLYSQSLLDPSRVTYIELNLISYFSHNFLSDAV